MEVQGLSRQALGVYEIVRAQTGTGRLALPVKGSQVYANFKHITGIGPLGSRPAFSVSQLRNLDNLIDRLKMLKGESIQDVSLNQLNSGKLSEMIEEYTNELNAELKKDNPYRSNMNVSGIALDIFA